MSATHTHDGPGALANHSTRYFWLAMDIYQHDVYRRIVTQLADVVVAALDDLRPARIGHGSGAEVRKASTATAVAAMQRYNDDDKADGDGIYDADELRHRIGVIRVDDAETNQPMAVVINWAAHGIAFDVENQYFSGDVLGSVERETEQTHAGARVRDAGAEHRRRCQPRGVSNDNKLQRIESYGKRMAPQVASDQPGHRRVPDPRRTCARCHSA